MSGRLSVEQRRDIRSNDPLVRSVLEAVAVSPLTDNEIEHRAGCPGNLLTRLRKGTGSTRMVTFVSLAEAVGFKVIVVKEA